MGKTYQFGTNLDLHEGLLDAQTMFEIMWIEAFENPSAFGGYQSYTALRRTNSKKIDINTMGPGPVMSEWTGEKEFRQFRHYDLEIEVKNYSKNIALDANDVRYDPSGAIAEKLRAFFATGGDRDLDKLVFDALVSNSGAGPTGYDGVSLINDSHPHLNGGSGLDNKTTSALTFDTYDTAYQTITEARDEEGESLGLTPSLLMVGPKNRKMALQIANAEGRALPIDNTGAEASSSVVAVSTIPNVFVGDVVVFVNPRMLGTQDDYWYLMDATSPEKLPMGFMLNRAPTLVSKDDDWDDNRFYNNEVHHSIELDGNTFAGVPASIYGGIVA